MVEARASGITGLDDALDAIEAEILTVLAVDPTLGGLTKGVDFTGSEIDIASAEQPIGTNKMTFRAAYRHAHHLSSAQSQALRAIATCRTVALGGHLETCDRCGTSRAVYHSCSNRHCPRCQSLAAQRCCDARRAELLPVAYFHVVFTLPHELNALARRHPCLVYNLLFAAASATLKGFAKDSKYLGGDVGVAEELPVRQAPLAVVIRSR